jgi:hypothetical protein
VNLATDLVCERRITQLLIGHAMDVTRVLGSLRDDLVVVIRHNDALTVEPKIPAMKLSRHPAPPFLSCSLDWDPIPV